MYCQSHKSWSMNLLKYACMQQLVCAGSHRYTPIMPSIQYNNCKCLPALPIWKIKRYHLKKELYSLYLFIFHCLIDSFYSSHSEVEAPPPITTCKKLQKSIGIHYQKFTKTPNLAFFFPKSRFFSGE